MKPKKHTVQNEFFYISLSFFIVVSCWVGFSLYQTKVTSTISGNLQVQMVPIQSFFDFAYIQKLSSRKSVAPLDNFPSAAPGQPASGNGSGTIVPKSVTPSVLHPGI
jgi:hypothetical protein